MSTRQRRTRYTVTFQDGSKSVFLGYSAQDALNFYNARGKLVKGITKGDYRKHEAKHEAFKSGGFRIKTLEQRKAIEMLGIEFPVSIHMSNHFSHVSGKDGHHILKRDKDGTLYHEIMLKSYLTPARASFVLWHELTHAMQAERDGRKTWEGYLEVSAQQHTFPYSRRPWEREANAIAEENEDIVLCF